jgi:hypothetical protein
VRLENGFATSVSALLTETGRSRVQSLSDAKLSRRADRAAVNSDIGDHDRGLARKGWEATSIMKRRSAASSPDVAASILRLRDVNAKEGVIEAGRASRRKPDVCFPALLCKTHVGLTPRRSPTPTSHHSLHNRFTTLAIFPANSSVKLG